MRTTAYRACDLCEAICGLELQFEDGALAAIRGDAADPFVATGVLPRAIADFAGRGVKVDPSLFKRAK